MVVSNALHDRRTHKQSTQFSPNAIKARISHFKAFPDVGI